jgi:penicillin-binding protein 1A
MASAFSIFANGGYRVEPYFISRIEDANHTVLEMANPARACGLPGTDVKPGCAELPRNESLAAPALAPAPGALSTPGKSDVANPPAPRYAPRVITPQNAFLMTSILRDVISGGTGTGAMVLGRHDLAGKTGTTNDHRDAWFNGFNPEVVTTAWIGFDQPTPLGRGEVGGTAALPMWVDYMRVALDGVPEQPLLKPDGVITAIINRESGKLTTQDDPNGMAEYFVSGTQPTEAGGAAGTPAAGGSGENVREGLF